MGKGNSSIAFRYNRNGNNWRLRMYLLTFKENRKYELTVNNQIVAIFYGRETKELDDSIVESKDFESDRNYFIVEKSIESTRTQEKIVKKIKGEE
jgi:hypothetical protein